MRPFVKLVLPTLVAMLVGVHDKASAAAFAIIENSASGQGMAFAGGGAIAWDASATWFNPAAIVRLDDQLQVSGSYIAPSFKYSDRGSVQETPFGNLPLLPASEKHNNGARHGVVPNLYVVRALNDEFSFGLAINAPFGLVSEYNHDWVGRYQAVESALKTVNVNPSIAWRIDRQWSIAVGVSLDYLDVKLTNALDFATICAAQILAVCPNGALPGQGAFDGFVRNSGNDVSPGANIGLMWASDSTRVSLHWRSEIEHHLKGNAKFTTPSTLGGLDALPEPLAGDLAAMFTNSNIRADVTLPDSVAFGVYHQFTPQWGVAGDITWTDWADIQAVVIQFENPLTPTGVEALGFNAAWRYALGVQYQANERWTLRTGTAFDESPTPNAALRSARLPDADRTWLSVGASYQVGSQYSVDMGYTHLFIKDASINRLGATDDRLTGYYNSSVNIVSLQLNHRF
tara:strand:+ start:41861 stop:43234 length:1374 start_codon:yes stop_codon:yes gene_type:complete